MMRLCSTVFQILWHDRLAHGWLVAPEALVPQIEKLAQNLYISVTTVSQYAALAAFSDEAVAIHEARRMAFAERRDYLVGALRELGFTVPHCLRVRFMCMPMCRRSPKQPPMVFGFAGARRRGGHAW